jgi:hypothetical protein
LKLNYKLYNHTDLGDSQHVIYFRSSIEKEPKDDECGNADDTKNAANEGEIGGTPDPRIFRRNSIFITGLPSTMTEQRLFDTLWDVFSTVGKIEVTKRKIL